MIEQCPLCGAQDALRALSRNDWNRSRGETPDNLRECEVCGLVFGFSDADSIVYAHLIQGKERNIWRDREPNAPPWIVSHNESLPTGNTGD